MNKLLFALFTVLLISSTYEETINSGGQNRNIIVYAPSGLPQGAALLISMHGYNQDAGYQQNQAKYEEVADKEKFVVVYPDGINRAWDISGDKDINFILDIIEEMNKKHGIDKKKVYLSGFSMGGMFTYMAMNRIADKIACFAPCSGYNMGGANTQSSRPVPFIHVHGTADDVCSYDPVMSHLEAWAKAQKCGAAETITPYPEGTSSTASLIRWKGCEGDVEIAHLKLPGKGHWHSNDPLFAKTNEEVWKFCSKYSL